MQCRGCGSTSLRVSRVGLADVGRLLLLQYPIRCRECGARDFATLPAAVAIHRAFMNNRRKRKTGARQR